MTPEVFLLACQYRASFFSRYWVWLEKRQSNHTRIRNPPLHRTILVTGGAGYIGSHACKALARAGYQPVVYDNLSRGHQWAVKWGPLEIGDILDRERLQQVMARWQPAAVMHFAAFAYVGESVDHPEMYYRNNTVGSLTIIEAMAITGVDKIVFSSTCAVYGEPTAIPMDESHPRQPVNPYGFSKMAVERMLADADAAHGIRHTCLRYFNAAGADPDGEIGEVHDPETHLIPLVLDVAAGRRDSLHVFGDDYDTPDGTCLRDYIHVNDLAQAHLLALSAMEAGAASSVYNLGNGSGFSVKQIIAAAEAITGRKIPYAISDRRPGDPAALVGDAKKITAELGWHPAFADITTIIDTAWQWHLKRSTPQSPQ
jgi:UDP-arabinose 4-epimerase